MTYVPIDPSGRFRDVEQRFREMSRCQAAAQQARREFPGPLGELVHRELIAYAEFGYWFGDNVVPRLVEELLGTRSNDCRGGRAS